MRKWEENSLFWVGVGLIKKILEVGGEVWVDNAKVEGGGS